MGNTEGRHPSEVAAIERLERIVGLVQRLMLLLVPVWAIAAIGVVTGSPIDEWRLNAAILVSLPAQLWSLFSLKRAVRRLKRADAVTRKATLSTWIRAIVTNALMMALVFGVGYLVRGWLGAVVLTASALLIGGVSLGIGLKRRRRKTAASIT